MNANAPVHCCHCAPYFNQQYKEANGFIGGHNYKFARFCEELYVVLYSERDGHDDTVQILTELYLRSGIDGTDVARRNGFDAFEMLIKAPILQHVVGYERTGTDYSFRYYARLTPEFESIRQKIIPRRRAFGRMERQ